jgi:hypothetical protein
MKRVSYKDITLAGATSIDVSAYEKCRKAEAIFLQKHPEMSPQPVLYIKTVLSQVHHFVL